MRSEETTGVWRRGLTAAVAACLCLGLSGCLIIGGKSERRTLPTLGQQLVDLKQARDNGAISDEEYHRAKERMLEGDCRR